MSAALISALWLASAIPAYGHCLANGQRGMTPAEFGFDRVYSLFCALTGPFYWIMVITVALIQDTRPFEHGFLFRWRKPEGGAS